MNKLLIVQNITREGPGLLDEVLREEQIDYDLVNLDGGDQFPSPESYGAVVVLGGPDSANDTTDKMTSELSQVRTVLDRNIPYLGICLGLQVAVKAGGGKVVPGTVKEIGLFDMDGQQNTLQVTEAGMEDPLLNGLGSTLKVFQLHGETVETTDSMQVLATGKHCRNQIVKVGPQAYGIQSHFELTPGMLALWAAEDPDLIPLGKDNLLRDFKAIETEYTQIGKALLRNFIALAGLRK